MGLWSRTLRLVACGIKPVFVFDAVWAPGAGAEPESVAHGGPPGAMRVVRVTPTHVEECKKLLGLMGMPVVQAPPGGEAEAQCAELCRVGKVFAVGSEDMDALTFGAPVLLRHLTYSEARKLPVVEIELPKGACACPRRREGVCALTHSLAR
jgi:flap endonuclease-1